MHSKRQGSQQFPRTIFPDFLLKIHSFSLTKMLKKGSFSRNQDENRPFFHDQNRPIFHFVVKKLIASFKNTPTSFIIVSCADISGYHNYLKDPPWLGPTRKFSKNRDSKIGWKPSNSRHSGKKIPWPFPDFWENLQKFPDFSRFSLTFSKNSPFSRFSRFSLTDGNPAKGTMM